MGESRILGRMGNLVRFLESFHINLGWVRWKVLLQPAKTTNHVECVAMVEQVARARSRRGEVEGAGCVEMQENTVSGAVGYGWGWG